MGFGDSGNRTRERRSRTREPGQAPEADTGDRATSGPTQGRKTAGFGFRGQAAAAELTRTKKDQERRRDSTWWFWLGRGEERTIIFLDGGLGAPDQHGNCVLTTEAPVFYAHRVPYGRRYENVLCPLRVGNPVDGRTDRCPICEQGDDPTCYAAFSILDVTPPPKKDQAARRDSKRLPYRRRLLAATYTDLQALNVRAVRIQEDKNRREPYKDGLRGCRYVVSRLGGEKSPRIGDEWQLVRIEDLRALADKCEKLGGKREDVEPIDFEHEPTLAWRSGQEIEDAGLVGRGRSTADESRAPRNADADAEL